MLRIICNSAKGNSTEEVAIFEDCNEEEIFAKIEELYARIISITLEFSEVNSSGSDNCVEIPKTSSESEDIIISNNEETDLANLEVEEDEEVVEVNPTDSESLKTEECSDRITECPNIEPSDNILAQSAIETEIQTASQELPEVQRHNIAQTEKSTEERGNVEAETLISNVVVPEEKKENSIQKREVICEENKPTEQANERIYQVIERKLSAEQIEFITQYDLKKIKEIFWSNSMPMERMYEYLLMFGLEPGKSSFEVFAKAVELHRNESNIDDLAKKVATSISRQTHKEVNMTQLMILLVHQYKKITNNQSKLKMIPFIKLVKTIIKEDIVLCTRN